MLAERTHFFSSGVASGVAFGENDERERASASALSGPPMQWKMGLNSSQIIQTPCHNPIGSNSVLGQVNVISVDVDLGTPWNRATFLEDLHNTWHFFVNGRVFELCSGQFLREECNGVTVLLNDSAQLQIRCVGVDIARDVGIQKSEEHLFGDMLLDGVESFD